MNEKIRMERIDDAIRELLMIKKELYNQYFDINKKEYSLLTDIPSNPYDIKGEENYVHTLREYSSLNVDVVGKMICKLIKKYNNLDVVSKRITKICKIEPTLGNWASHYSKITYQVIGKKNEVKQLNDVDNNIVIGYEFMSEIEEYPTSKPVEWLFNEHGQPYIKSNYSHLIGLHDNLTFKCPDNKEYIKELIYSLAFYQKQHDIMQMTPEQTWNVYRRIYKKH